MVPESISASCLLGDFTSFYPGHTGNDSLDSTNLAPKKGVSNTIIEYESESYMSSMPESLLVSS